MPNPKFLAQHVHVHADQPELAIRRDHLGPSGTKFLRPLGNHSEGGIGQKRDDIFFWFFLVKPNSQTGTLVYLGLARAMVVDLHQDGRVGRDKTPRPRRVLQGSGPRNPCVQEGTRIIPVLLDRPWIGYKTKPHA